MLSTFPQNPLDLIELLVSNVGGEHVLNLNRDLGVGLHDATVLELDLNLQNRRIQLR